MKNFIDFSKKVYKIVNNHTTIIKLFIMQNHLFEELTTKEVAEIKKHFIKLNFSSKDLIYSANEKSKNAFITDTENISDIWIYFIKQWFIRISVTYEGKKNTIAFLKKWDFFWEVSSIMNFKPTAEVLALSDTEINFINWKEFNELLLKIPQLTINLSKHLAERIQFQGSIIFDHVFRPLESRVASTIKNLSEEFGNKHKNWKITIWIKITHQDLADFVWTNRETITKILTKFKNSNIISFNKKKIIIEDVKYLMEVLKDKHSLKV